MAMVAPTTNQISELLRALEAHDFADLEVEELLLRSYKPNADRLRPADRMVAHTGYLIFGRKVVLPAGEQWRIVDAKRYKPRAAPGAAEESIEPEEADMDEA